MGNRGKLARAATGIWRGIDLTLRLLVNLLFLTLLILLLIFIMLVCGTCAGTDWLSLF